MVEIVLVNFGFWFNLLIPVAIGIYLYFTNRNMIAREVGIQFIATFAFLFIVYNIMFSFTVDLVDTEQRNSAVKSAHYQEGYEYEYDCSYEVCSGTGENETCVTIPQTCEAWKSPERFINTTNGETIYISAEEYNRYTAAFGHVEEDLYHSDQTWSSRNKGEGDIWHSYPNILMPASVTYSYENYVVAANHNVIHHTVSPEEIAAYKKNGKLKEYPETYHDKFGVPKQNRVIDTTGKGDFLVLRNELDDASARMGRAKQANPIIYITDETQDFKWILDSYWNKAKKNDVVLLLGVDGNKVVWSDVIAWTDNADLFVNAESEFKGLDIRNPDIVKKFETLIFADYKRKPMKDFDYLKENITLDFQWQALIFVLNVLLSGGLMYFFMRNEFSK